jgi:DNA modification methylase
VHQPVFTFGRASLYKGDCVAWLREWEQNSVQGVVTDPPYGLVEYTAKELRARRNNKGVWRLPRSYDGYERAPVPRFTELRPKDVERLAAFFHAWAAELVLTLVPGAHVLIASNPLLSHTVALSVQSAGLEHRGKVTRLVHTMRGGDRPKYAHEEFRDVSVIPRSMHEPWLLFRKPLDGTIRQNLKRWKTGGLRRPASGGPFGDVIRSGRAEKAERALAPHPTLKPQAFLRQVVRAILPLGEGIVLDPFAGSGSTLAAAEAIGYESIGVELSPTWVRLATEAIPRLAEFDAPPRPEKPAEEGKPSRVKAGDLVSAAVST